MSLAVVRFLLSACLPARLSVSHAFVECNRVHALLVSCVYRSDADFSTTGLRGNHVLFGVCVLDTQIWGFCQVDHQMCLRGFQADSRAGFCSEPMCEWLCNRPPTRVQTFICRAFQAPNHGFFLPHEDS